MRRIVFTPKQMKIVKWAVGLALALAVMFLIAVHWRPGRGTYPVQGISVSHDNGDISWPMVADDGVSFAYIKATEGADMHDTRFAENWAAAGKAGLRRGAWHYFTLCRLASDQATNFIVTVPRDRDALPAALTLQFAGNCAERPARDVVLKEIAAFIRTAEGHTGKPMMLHISRDFEDYYHVSDSINRTLWLTASPFPPTYGARLWSIWQSSGIQRVHGISGPVSWNVVHK
jgi:lysozyme